MAVEPHHVNLHNADGRSSWVAGESEFFSGKTLEESKKLMGTVLEDKFLYAQPVRTFDHIDDGDIPDTFDARTQ